MAIQGLPLALEHREGRQGGLDRPRLDGRQEQLADGLVEMADRKGLTQRCGVVDLRPLTLVAEIMAAMADAHPPSTAAADHQALQQRMALARRAAALSPEVVQVLSALTPDLAT